MSKNIIKGLVFTFLGLTLIACSRRSGQTADNSAPGVQISNNQSSTTESKGEKVENSKDPEFVWYRARVGNQYGYIPYYRASNPRK